MRLCLRSMVVLSLLAMSACRPAPVPKPHADPSSRRITRTGEVIGFKGIYGQHVWNGIPFAKPPVDGLRWRAPRRPEAWTGIREAIEPGAICTQFPSRFGGRPGAEGEILGSEDCLFLNVAAPAMFPDQLPAAGKRLPVMLWIHGGGNTIGESTFYDGGNLAVTHNVVVVTTNYRLGPFGWFRHAALRDDAGSADDVSGNYGTLDLVRALEWVRDNIENFGGDPNNVTIFGESAGGGNVMTLLASPRASGLFHRAIVQSGGTWTDTPALGENFTDDPEPGHARSSSEVLVDLLIRDGKASDRTTAKAAVARMTSEQIRHYLRGKSAGEILATYESIRGTGMVDLPKVFRDGMVLPAEPIQERLALTDGYNRVPVLLGTNRDENKLFMFGDPEFATKLLWLLPRVRDPRAYDLTAEYLSKMWKATGVDMPASAMSSNAAGQVFAYRFDWDEEPTVAGTNLSQMLGAAHGFEIPFVFGHFNLGSEGNQIFSDENLPGRKALSGQMMSYWAEFAYRGNPGRGRDGTLPQWDAWDLNPEKRYMVLDTPQGGGSRMAGETWSKSSVLSAIAADARFEGQKERCAMYGALVTRSRALSRNEYETADPQGCGGFPL